MMQMYRVVPCFRQPISDKVMKAKCMPPTLVRLSREYDREHATDNSSHTGPRVLPAALEPHIRATCIWSREVSVTAPTAGC